MSGNPSRLLTCTPVQLDPADGEGASLQCGTATECLAGQHKGATPSTVPRQTMINSLERYQVGTLLRGELLCARHLRAAAVIQSVHNRQVGRTGNCWLPGGARSPPPTHTHMHGMKQSTAAGVTRVTCSFRRLPSLQIRTARKVVKVSRIIRPTSGDRVGSAKRPSPCGPQIPRPTGAGVAIIVTIIKVSCGAGWWHQGADQPHEAHNQCSCK